MLQVVNVLKIYIIFCLVIHVCNYISEAAEKIRYISTEHPRVTSINLKYVTYANLTSQRYGRDSPIYYVGLHFNTLIQFDENVIVDLYFYEFLTNVYKPSFIQMHHNFCDLIHKNLFFGFAMKQGKLVKPCPYPPGEYNLYNMTIPIEQIPKNFPFLKGRITANLTFKKEHLASGYIDMEVKEWRKPSRKH